MKAEFKKLVLTSSPYRSTNDWGFNGVAGNLHRFNSKLTLIEGRYYYRHIPSTKYSRWYYNDHMIQNEPKSVEDCLVQVRYTYPSLPSILCELNFCPKDDTLNFEKSQRDRIKRMGAIVKSIDIISEPFTFVKA